MVTSAEMRSTFSTLCSSFTRLPPAQAAVTLGKAEMPNACVMAGTMVNSVRAFV